jgi:hypothetical protein
MERFSKQNYRSGWINGRVVKKVDIRPEYNIIVTEGTKTEPYYFEGFQEKINEKYRGRVDVRIYGEGRNTLSLLKKAVEYVRNSGNVIKHVWIVYDKDDFSDENFNETAFHCAGLSNNNITYHAIWSNECVELWFLLHFEYFNRKVNRACYYPILSGYLKQLTGKEYTKNRKDMFKVLYSRMDNAVLNAKKLEKTHSSAIPSENTPGTAVYKLVEYLQKYL